jgi:hypothetical protein
VGGGCLAGGRRRAYDCLIRQQDPCMRHRFAIALVVILAAAGLPTAAAAAPAGQVLALFGSSFVESGGRKQGLQLGSPVAVGDTVEVPAGAKLKLRMADGSIISVASGSHLTIADYNTGKDGKGRDVKLALASGLLRAVVASVSGPSHFEVSTATGVAAVRSTDWLVEATPRYTQVGVLTGEVDCTSAATGRSVLVRPGWGTRMFKGLDPVPPRKWLKSEFDSVIARTNLGSP